MKEGTLTEQEEEEHRAAGQEEEEHRAAGQEEEHRVGRRRVGLLQQDGRAGEEDA